MGVKAELSVRKVESETYFEFLKDVATKEYYDWFFPFDEKPELRGSLLWHKEKEMDGWEALLCAIISLAAKEYVEAVVYEMEYKRPHPAKKDIEEYLSEWSPDILDGLKAEIRYAGRWGLERLLHRMRVMW